MLYGQLSLVWVCNLFVCTDISHPFVRAIHVTYGHEILKPNPIMSFFVSHVEAEKSSIAPCVGPMMMQAFIGAKEAELEVFIIHRRLLSRCPDPSLRRGIAIQKLDVMPFETSSRPQTPIRHRLFGISLSL